MTARENATQELLYFIDRLAPGSDNRDIYEKRLKAMTNAQFEAFIAKLESEEEILALFIPNLGKAQVTIENNYQVAEELGHEFFQRLYLTDPDTGDVYLTPVKHLVVDLTLRRQAQMLNKKMSIPEHNQAVDERSGQPAEASKGSRMSYPELQVNAAKGGLDQPIVELIKFRGGDVRAFNAMNRQILETGEASLEAIQVSQPSSVKSTQTLATLLKAMHIRPNF